MKMIATKNGLSTLLDRYTRAGVTDDTLARSGTYKARWISVIKNCIASGLALDEDDYNNTTKELQILWKGLK